MAHYLTINAGSSSLKTAVFDASLRRLGHVSIQNLLGNATVKLKGFDAKVSSVDFSLDVNATRQDRLNQALIGSLKIYADALGIEAFDAVGHRVVHGGDHFQAPIRMDDKALRVLHELEGLAPLHQPYNLQLVSWIKEQHPNWQQIACFDTAFHQSQSALERTYALPKSWRDAGVKRYGFHGLSYEHISNLIENTLGWSQAGNTLVAHLGNGASLCGIKAGKSFTTTMGFSALDGLVMGTRCGQLDPGVVLFALESLKLDAKSISHQLYAESGLKGLSELTNNMQALCESAESNAKLAVDVFIQSLIKQIGACAAALGGIDTLVFTAGIGENSPIIRQLTCERLKWLGVDVDDSKNKAGEEQIQSVKSRIRVMIIPTDEEVIIARACQKFADSATSLELEC